MVTRGRSSSSSPSLRDAPRVGVFSGHPLLVALKAAQIIKVINKGPLCFTPDYTGACGNNSIMSRQGLVKSSDWNKDVSCLDKSWAVSGALEPISHTLVLCPIGVRCHCPLSSLTLLYILLRFHSSNARSCFPNGEELTGLAEGHAPPPEGSCCVLLAVPVSSCS